MSHLRIVILIVVLLAAMGVTGVLGRRHALGAIALALVSLTWLLVNGDFEGAILFVIAAGHGVTASDLVGIAGLLVAAAQLWRLLARHRSTCK